MKALTLALLGGVLSILGGQMDANASVLIDMKANAKGKLPFGVVGGKGSKHELKALNHAEHSDVLELTWQAKSKRFFELYSNDKPFIEAFKAGVTLSFKVDTSKAKGLTGMAVRARDAMGETWHFGAKLDPKIAGWQTVELVLNPKGKGVQSYGGDKKTAKRVDLPLQFGSLCFMAPHEISSPISIQVSNITRNPVDPAHLEPEIEANAITAKLVYDAPFPAMLKGAESAASIEVRLDKGRKARAVDVDFVIQDFYKTRRVHSVKGQALSDAAPLVMPLGTLVKQYGWYRVTPVLKLAKGASKPLKEVSFIYIDPVGPYKNRPDDAFKFGMDIRLHKHNAEWQVASAKMLGVDIARGGATWPRVEVKKGEYDWSRNDAFVEMYNDAGITVQYGFSFTPDWAVDPVAKKKALVHFNKNKKGKKHKKGAKAQMEPHPSRLHPNLEDWRSFIIATCKHIKEKNLDMDYFEIWNEPDLFGFYMGKTDDYLKMLAVAHEEIHKHLPNAKVMTGGIATTGGHGGQSYNPDLIKRTIQEGKYDVLNLHEHGDFSRFVNMIDGNVASYLKGMKRPPLYFNETGFAATWKLERGKYDRYEHAQQLVKKMSFAISRGAIGLNWFAFHYPGHEGGYSMTAPDKSPYPIVAAYNEMVRQLRGETFVAQGDVGDANWALQFKKAGETTVLLWDEESFSQGMVMPLQVKGVSTVMVKDVMGNGDTMPVKDDLVLLPISKQLRYIQATTHDVAMLPPLVRFEQEPYGEPGKEVSVTAILTNPTSSPQTVKLQWKGPTKEVANISIPANDSAKVSVEVVMPRSNGKEKPQVLLSYNYVSKGWTGEVNLPMNPAKVIPSKPFSEREADFVMDKDSFIHNRNNADPNRAHLTWKGPKDISSKVWLRATDTALVIQADVTDDKHHQPNEIRNSWKADGLQVAISIPGVKNLWEFGVAQQNDGTADIIAFKAPAGVSKEYAKTAKVTVSPIAGGKRYHVTLPYTGSKMSHELLQTRAIRLNVIANDDDGGGREGFCFMAPGLGTGGHRPDQWPLITFE